MLPLYIPFPDFGTEVFGFDVGTMRFALRWYALAYIVGILIAWWMCRKALIRTTLWPDNCPPMTSKQLEDLVTWIVLGIIIGGRLGFVLFYKPAFYLQNPAEILMVWQGGMSFHGGFIGVVAASLIFCFRNGIPILPTADLLALATPPGLFLGRLANFSNNELWGRPTDVPWAVAFPGEAAQSCVGVVGICARHPSQLYEAILEGLVLGVVLVFLGWKRGWLRNPGKITGLFFLGYGSARYLVEFFRQPDAQFVTQENPVGHVIHWVNSGLTMGQLLSLPMITVGLGLIAWSLWRGKERHEKMSKSYPSEG
jgi:phosphatidylglycerol:prolipoprotein diacylglycerol transferase